ncbi:MAG: sugar phosphate isomerase/epimerase family protein [Pseudomonadales bacterium]
MDIKKRKFVRLLGTSLIAPSLLSACSVPGSRNAATLASNEFSFGLQLSTITPLLLSDFEGTLTEVAKVGYSQVEFSAMGFLGRPAAQVKALLAENGLSAPVGRVSPMLPEGFFQLSRPEMMSAFMQLSSLDKLVDNVRYSLQVAHTLDQRFLNIPAINPSSFANTTSLNQIIDLLSEAGEVCSAEGVLLGYHNHDWEFAPIRNEAGAAVVPYDVMLEKTDAKLVSFQLDAHWVTKAGADMYGYLERYPGRFASCHLKDIDAEGGMADVGEGEIDFPKFIQAAKRSGAQHFFVERDNPPEPMKSATVSFANLSRMKL